MNTAKRRASDLRLLALAATAVVGAGLLIAVGIYAATDRGDGAGCGTIDLGVASELRDRIDDGGPYFVAAGGDCAVWLALDGDEIVAVKPTIAGRDCSVRWEGDAFTCGGDVVSLEDVERVPTRLGTGDLDGHVLAVFEEPGG